MGALHRAGVPSGAEQCWLAAGLGLLQCSAAVSEAGPLAPSALHTAGRGRDGWVLCMRPGKPPPLPGSALGQKARMHRSLPQQH